MKFFLVISALVAVAVAKPGVLHGAAVVAPLAYTRLVPGAPIGLDGRVVDTPEVAHAKAEHAAAHINERVSLANEAVKSADVVATYAAPAVVAGYSAPAVVSAYSAPAVVAPAVVPAAVTIARGATVGLDGRVVDTPEVAAAKVAHAAAHISAKVTLANEAARNYAAFAPAPAVVSAYSAPVVSAVYPAAHSLVY